MEEITLVGKTYEGKKITGFDAIHGTNTVRIYFEDGTFDALSKVEAVRFANTFSEAPGVVEETDSAVVDEETTSETTGEDVSGSETISSESTLDTGVDSGADAEDGKAGEGSIIHTGNSISTGGSGESITVEGYSSTTEEGSEEGGEEITKEESGEEITEEESGEEITKEGNQEVTN